MLEIFKKIKHKFIIFKDINFIIQKKPKIIFYSESLSYQKYANLLIKILAEKYPNQVYYVSSDENDRIDNLNVTNLFIGKGFLMQYFFSSIITDNLLLTLTDLNNHLIKKSKNVKKYIYYFHAPASTTKVYTETAFDNYDTILCNGQYQIDEIKKRETIKNITKKKLIKNGYFYFDYLKEKINEKVVADEILIAPSWNYNQKNFMNENIELIIEKTLKKGFKVRFRPHPENLNRSKLYLNTIKNKFSNQQFFYDDKPENLQSMEKAKCLITDSSGIAIEYALIFKKPVLYLDGVEKIHNNEFSNYRDLITIDEKIRDKYGYILKIDEIDNIDNLIIIAISSFKKNKTEIENFINQNFYNYGETVKKFKENITNIL
jgi:YidC/Oxa1 family membrane protein insertase